MASRDYQRSSLPPVAASDALLELGLAIRTARLRRRQTAADVAARIGVSLPTFRKLARGDPSVSLGTFVTTAWLFDLLPQLMDSMRPEADRLAAALDAARVPQRARRPRDVNLDDL
jgi:transcriptional regulator with XRE-family HTH domain